MFTLVIGGAASGKSEYAEQLVTGLDGRRIYLATMEPFGPEARARIDRHRSMRSQKGFETIERFIDLKNTPLPPDANILLEDLGNLLANEMYSPKGSDQKAVEVILEGVEVLLSRCRHLTIVTNEICSGGTDYEGDTLNYMQNLGRINCCLAARADRVVEVICGIAQIRKEACHVDH